MNVLFDASVLHPTTRNWGPGVVLNELKKRITGSINLRGHSIEFAGANNLDISTFPDTKRFKAFFYDYQLLTAPKHDIYWGTNHLMPKYFRSKKSVVTFHDLIFLKYPEEIGLRFYKFKKNQYEYSLRNASKVIAISNSVADELISNFPYVKSKLEIIYNSYKIVAVNNQLTMPVDVSRSYAVVPGSYKKRKNMDLIMQIANSLESQNIDMAIYITGTLPPHMYKVPKNIIFTDNLSDEQLYLLLQHARILLYPSIYEGFGLPLLEAMYNKCPVICSDIPVFREIAQNAAIFAGNNSNKWIEAIKSLILTNRSNEMIYAGLENIKRFDWNNSAKLYTEVFTNLHQT